LLAHLFRRRQQVVQVTAPFQPRDPFGGQQKDELFKLALLLGQGHGIEQLERLLRRSLVISIEAGMPDRGHDDPVAGQIDGIAVGLIDRGHFPAGKRAIERIFRPPALQGDDGLHAGRKKDAQDGVAVFAVHFHVFFARKGVARRVIGGSSVAEQLAEKHRQEIGQDFLLLEAVDPVRLNQAGPLAQFRAKALDRGRQIQVLQMLPQHVRTEKRLGFERHWRTFSARNSTRQYMQAEYDHLEALKKGPRKMAP
jgi:hypothetical protein